MSWLDHTLEKLDLVLLMSVNPGFGGQQFIRSVLPKISEVRRRIDAARKDIWLEVDGGIKTDNIAEVARAGADVRRRLRDLRLEGLRGDHPRHAATSPQ